MSNYRKASFLLVVASICLLTVSCSNASEQSVSGSTRAEVSFCSSDWGSVGPSMGDYQGYATAKEVIEASDAVVMVELESWRCTPTELMSGDDSVTPFLEVDFRVLEVGKGQVDLGQIVTLEEYVHSPLSFFYEDQLESLGQGHKFVLFLNAGENTSRNELMYPTDMQFSVQSFEEGEVPDLQPFTKYGGRSLGMSYAELWEELHS